MSVEWRYNVESHENSVPIKDSQKIIVVSVGIGETLMREIGTWMGNIYSISRNPEHCMSRSSISHFGLFKPPGRILLRVQIQILQSPYRITV